jgi:molecular chaperone DnaK
MGRIVGIDLGTTNSVIAIVDAGGVKILENRENERLTPSVVSFHKGEFVVGSPALRVYLLEPRNTIISIKRLMGRAISDPEVQRVKSKYLYEIVEPSDGTKDSVRVKIGGREYSPVDISAMILTKLKKDAEYILGEKITHAVITVPAYFSDKQRQATREAGLKAGLTVMKILDEPTAAAIAYGVQSKDNEAKYILVYDLGGGTFDVSILVMSAGAFSVLNLEGDMWLGGDDFDQVIVDYVVRKVKREYNVDPLENHRFMATLKMEARKAKETLSSRRIADIIIPGSLQDNSGNIIDIEIEITREWFEENIKSLVERTIFITKKALENAALSPNDIDYVLMVGSATRIPKVQEAVEQFFGAEKVLRKIHPKECVAIGAAIAAVLFKAINCPKCGHDNDFEAKKCGKCGALLVVDKKICPSCGSENIKDVDRCEVCGRTFFVAESIIGGIAPFHYGIQTEGDKFNIFIRKGAQYPTPEEEQIVQIFCTRYPNQRIIALPIYGGENLDYASKNTKQGEAFAILPPNYPEGTPIHVKLWLNRHGHFELKAYLDNGMDLKPWIMRGDIDQKVIEQLQEIEKQIAIKKENFSLDEKNNIDRLREELLNHLQRREFEKAIEKVEELKLFVEEAGEESKADEGAEEKILGFAEYIIRNYGWLIDPLDIYRLNSLIGDLKNAIKKGDKRLIRVKADALENEIFKLLEMRNQFGESVPTPLGIFLSMHAAIMFIIHPVDPAEAINLREELSDIELAFKNKQYYATKMLDAFLEKLTESVKRAQLIRPESTVCHMCGHTNPLGIRHCEKCKADLWLVRSIRF